MNRLAVLGSEGLGACLVLLGLLEGCSTTSPTTTIPTSNQDPRRTALLAVATECADRQKGLLRINRVDDDGKVHVTVLPGGQPDVAAFSACYKEKAPATLVAAERAASPAEMAESGTRSTSVAIQAINNRFLIPVVLNGTQRATFLLDTGANITVISPQLARRAGIEPLAGAGAAKSRARMASGQEVDVSLVRLKSMMVGLARIDNLQVAVYEIGVLDRTATPPLIVDGFLGADFLSRFTMTIDPHAGRLMLQLADVPVK